ncbi:MAG: MerR family transcriptional regulator [Aestuariivirga sp.]
MITEKSADAFRTISEVAESLSVPQHVLRFWESRFSQIKPMKRAGGRRYYRPADVELLRGIHDLLYKKGYTIRGVQLILKDEGQAYVTGIGRGEIMPRKSEVAAGIAPPPGTARVAPRPGRAPLAGEAPRVIHKLSATQSEALRGALKDLGDARKLLGATN